ncbi:chaplin family protein [Sphaerisporangium sp. NPDC088356]|uniref:chaplin family protein n=1 Tax=Sphaerisporangium sp. NPDC088356 TaxID=3154871 RepID=UPI003427CD42
MALSSGTALADTSGSGSVGGGNQLNLPINIPIDISGNAVAVAGESSASSRGGSSVQGGGGAGGIQGSTSGHGSVLGGNQVNAPINAPINACGNAVAVFGEATAGCRGGSSVRNGGGGRGAGGNRTSGHSSVLGGNQIVAPITAPINICGNSVAVIGEAFSGCQGGAHVKGGGGNGYNGNGPGRGPGAGGNLTDGRHSILGGNQIVAPITAPINVCGNAVGNGSAGCEGGVSVPPAGRGGGAGGNRTSGHSSVLGGNQIVAPITAPINVCGNSVAVLGQAFAGCRGGASVKGGGGRGAGGNLTDGRHSILGGNQIVAPITAPINVCGNAVAVLGDAAAGCLGGAHVGGPGNPGGPGGYGHWARSSGRVSGTRPAGYGLLSEMPLVSALHGEKGAGELTRQSSEAAPAGGLAKSLGLPELPETPGRADGVQKPPVPTADSPLGPVGKVLSGTPATGIVNSTPARDLPVTTGLMSAEQPLGVTGMNAGSLVALLVGGLLTASATLFAGTRRLRLRRR